MGLQFRGANVLGGGFGTLKIKLVKLIDSIVGRLLTACLPRPRKVVGRPVQSILLIRPGGIGDAVMLMPCIAALKSAYPDASIDVLAERRNFRIFNLCPKVNHLYCYDRPFDFIRVMVRRYSVVIDSEQWHRLSAVFARLIRSDVKVGFATNERARMFTAVVDYSHADYELCSFLRLLQPLGIAHAESFSGPFLQIPAAVKNSAELLGQNRKNYVVLFPGASIEERRWGGQRFGELAERFVASGCTVVVVGGMDDVAAAEEIVARVPSAINLAGKTSLMETASFLRDAELLVSGDSGVLHIAVGLGTRTVSLFGPGIAAKWAPCGDLHIAVNHHLSCSPCTKFGTTPPCPIGAKCIQEITVDEVFREATKLLVSMTMGA